MHRVQDEGHDLGITGVVVEADIPLSACGSPFLVSRVVAVAGAAVRAPFTCLNQIGRSMNRGAAS